MIKAQETLRVPENNSFSDWCAVNKWVRCREMKMRDFWARNFHFSVCLLMFSFSSTRSLARFLHFSRFFKWNLKQAKWNRQSWLRTKKTSEKAPKSDVNFGWQANIYRICHTFSSEATIAPKCTKSGILRTHQQRANKKLITKRSSKLLRGKQTANRLTWIRGPY